LRYQLLDSEISRGEQGLVSKDGEDLVGGAESDGDQGLVLTESEDNVDKTPHARRIERILGCQF